MLNNGLYRVNLGRCNSFVPNPRVEALWTPLGQRKFGRANPIEPAGNSTHLHTTPTDGRHLTDSIPPSTESDARPFVFFFFRGPMSLDDHLHQDEWILNRIPAHGIYRFTSIEANFGHWCQVFDGRIHSQLFCGLPRVVCNWIRLVSGDSQRGITSANPRGTVAIPEEWSGFSADGCHGFHSIDT